MPITTDPGSDPCVSFENGCDDADNISTSNSTAPEPAALPVHEGADCEEDHGTDCA